MRYRKLGSTGLMVSEVSFGTIPVLKGSVPVLPAYYNLSEEQALAVMEHAFRLGCGMVRASRLPQKAKASLPIRFSVDGRRTFRRLRHRKKPLSQRRAGAGRDGACLSPGLQPV